MTNQSVILKITDRAVLMEIEEIIFSTDGYIIAPDNSGRCDLLVCEITNENAEEQFNFIERTMYSGMAGSLFLVSAATEPNILIQALKIGPKGFFQLPLKHDDVRSALLKLRTDSSAGKAGTNAAPAKEGTIIYIIGSKGGVGTTTITVNLATELVSSQARNTVALIDMNLLFGDIPIFLDIQSPPFDWAEIARNIARLDSNFLMGTLFKHPSGLNVLPSPTGIFESFASGPDIITKLLGLMKTMFDYIVIDGGQDLGEMSKAIMKIADRVVIVTLLNLPCLINVKRLRDAFLRLGYPSDDRVSVIANRVNKKTSNISVEDAERTTKKKITWTVPNDFQNTMDAINMGKTLREIAPASEISKRIAQIAAIFEQQQVHEAGLKKRKSLLGIFS